MFSSSIIDKNHVNKLQLKFVMNKFKDQKQLKMNLEIVKNIARDGSKINIAK